MKYINVLGRLLEVQVVNSRFVARVVVNPWQA